MYGDVQTHDERVGADVGDLQLECVVDRRLGLGQVKDGVEPVTRETRTLVSQSACKQLRVDSLWQYSGVMLSSSASGSAPALRLMAEA